MQVPEKLALIGGSILLSSTLIFTLKSQASRILPHIVRPVQDIQQSNEDLNAQHGNDFDKQWYRAKQAGQKVGDWGTAKYYIDDGQNMHIGTGKLQDRLYHVVGNDTYSLHSINFEGNVQAPVDSTMLLSGVDDAFKDGNSSIQAINGLNRLDTSQVGNMFFMFANDNSLQSIDISGWNTSQVTTMDGMFINDLQLNHLNAGKLDTSKVNNYGWMFLRDGSLTQLDLSGWDPNGNVQPNMTLMFAGADHLRELNIEKFDTTNTNDDDIFSGKYDFNSNNELQKLTLGDKTTFRGDAGDIHGTWRNGNQTISGDQFKDNTAHPGTWIKQ